MILDFKKFLLIEANEIEKTLKKIPKHHKDLIRGFDFKFEKGNTLKGDGGHVGVLDPNHKKITIAAPWNYPREFTVLHEIGHLVWEKLPTKLKSEWKTVLKNTKGKKQNQSEEELFCMAYANNYAKNKVVIHDHPEWKEFISKIAKLS